MSDTASDRFGQRYRVTDEPVFTAIEREALGGVNQATGYTTLAEADDLGRYLELDENSLLLDVGSGCGYPGLYLAERTGCAVVTVDPVAAGASASNARSRADGPSDRHLAVVARGQDLPLRPDAFDSVVHVDALC